MAETILEKVGNSVRNGNFGEKVHEGLHREMVRYTRISNNNLLFLQEEQQAYQKYSSRYAAMIEAGVPELPLGEPCRKAWICWFQGEAAAPPLVKACIASARKNLPDYEIVVLDNESIGKYVEFPPYIADKWKAGMISPAHYSDLLRIALLCTYGGLWIDSTVLCTSNQIPDCILNAPLFVFKEMDLLHQDNPSILASSWLIQARSNEPILILTQKLLWYYWTEHKKVDNYFIFHLFFAMAARRYPEEWDAIPVFNNHSPHVLQFEISKTFSQERWEQLKRFSDFHKLNHHNDYSIYENSFYQHILMEYSTDSQAIPRVEPLAARSEA